MLITLSPSKGQDFEQAAPTQTYSEPTQINDSAILAKTLKGYSSEKIKDLMSVSDNLSELNYQRFQNFETPFTPKNAKQALFAFKGDVYSGINTASMNQADYEYAQVHLRILSGLYGSLKPLDLIQPYRLEMKTKLKTKRGDNLYQFWGESITELLNKSLEKHTNKVIVNLASNEYWKSVKPKQLKGEVINVAFKENKDGKSRIIAIFAKKARGMMADFIIRNRVESVEGLKDFNYENYKYDDKVSTDSLFVFSRKQPKPVTPLKKTQ
ncbi:MAG: peroxide stress protein YaaA [Marinicellaceae bacterium]